MWRRQVLMRDPREFKVESICPKSSMRHARSGVKQKFEQSEESFSSSSESEKMAEYSHRNNKKFVSAQSPRNEHQFNCSADEDQSAGKISEIENLIKLIEDLQTTIMNSTTPEKYNLRESTVASMETVLNQIKSQLNESQMKAGLSGSEESISSAVSMKNEVDDSINSQNRPTDSIKRPSLTLKTPSLNANSLEIPGSEIKANPSARSSIDSICSSPRDIQLPFDKAINGLSNPLQANAENEVLNCLINHLKNVLNQYNDGTQFPQSNFIDHLKRVLDAMVAVTGSKTVDGGSKDQLPKTKQCLEVELNKQKDGEQLVKKPNQIRVNFGVKSKNVDANKLLCCLIHYLKKLVRKTRPDIEIPNADKLTTISSLLDTLTDATQSGEFNPETLGKLLKVLQCLRCCLSATGQQTPDLKTKLQDILQLITNRGNVLTQDEQNMPTTSDAENAQVEEGKRDSQI